MNEQGGMWLRRGCVHYFVCVIVFFSKERFSFLSSNKKKSKENRVFGLLLLLRGVLLVISCHADALKTVRECGWTNDLVYSCCQKCFRKG